MFRYYLDKEEEKLFGYNISFLIKLAAKSDPYQVKHGIIKTIPMEDSFFQHKGTDKRNMMIIFSKDNDFNKYIRKSYMGNYYFGFRISYINFIKTFVAKDAGKRSLTVNKYLYSYIIKNKFQNKWLRNKNHMYIETRFKDHRKTHDFLILLDIQRRKNILKNLEAFFKFRIQNENDQHELIKFFMKLRREM